MATESKLRVFGQSDDLQQGSSLRMSLGFGLQLKCRASPKPCAASNCLQFVSTGRTALLREVCHLGSGVLPACCVLLRLIHTRTQTAVSELQFLDLTTISLIYKITQVFIWNSMWSRTVFCNLPQDQPNKMENIHVLNRIGCVFGLWLFHSLCGTCVEVVSYVCFVPKHTHSEFETA